ncbi:nuclear transport factor 2 family protein [Ensifer soli]|uniref:nuclear transport factor 2 family protein n=1 Tax=Ciceribacter sp. sgz301302 TaxID=3342379 RepID=UPI0035B7B127
MLMPDTVNRYFHADRDNDVDALLETFAAEAVVEDENASHRGTTAIREWWLAAKTATRYVAKPLESAMDEDTVRVRAQVSGQFPGSPVMLTHAFAIKDNKIVRLEIRT